MSSKSPQKKKGKSKRAHVLVAAVERATANFVERGRMIARENPDIETDMLSAVDEVQKTGEGMSAAAREFATDPCSSVKRGNMVSERAFHALRPATCQPKPRNFLFGLAQFSPLSPTHKSRGISRAAVHCSIQYTTQEGGRGGGKGVFSLLNLISTWGKKDGG